MEPLDLCFEFLLVRDSGKLGVLALGDVSVDGDETAVGGGVAAHLDDGAVGAGPLETVRLQSGGQLKPLAHHVLDIAAAIFAAFSVVANECFEGCARLAQFFGKLEQLNELVIHDHAVEVGVHHRDALIDRREQHIHLFGLCRQRGSLIMQIGDVEVDCHKPAVNHAPQIGPNDPAIAEHMLEGVFAIDPLLPALFQPCLAVVLIDGSLAVAKQFQTFVGGDPRDDLILETGEKPVLEAAVATDKPVIGVTDKEAYRQTFDDVGKLGFCQRLLRAVV